MQRINEIIPNVFDKIAGSNLHLLWYSEKDYEKRIERRRVEEINTNQKPS